MAATYTWGFMVLVFMALGLPVSAQNQCAPGDCDCLLRLAEGYAGQNNYEQAIRQYNAAIQCAPGQKQAINTRIEALFLQIDSLRVAAEIQREKTRETEKQVAAAAQRAAAKAAIMQARQHDAERQKTTADSLKGVAESALELAVQRQDSADAEARRTQEALDRLELVYGDLTDIFLQQADAFIKAVEFDSAYERVQEAEGLFVPDRGVAIRERQFELAYVFNEAGDTMLRDGLLVSLIRHIDESSGMDRQAVRDRLQEIDPALFDTLERRYFPQMLPVAGGTFRMGSKNGQPEERPVHQVTLSDFQMARTETTWWQYGLYFRATRIELPQSPSWGRVGDHPVVNVNWADAQGYIRWLNARDTAGYRLPTEAEWEYAARGGVPGAKDNFDYAGSNNLDDVAWYDKNSNGKTHPVAEKTPNALGLYDLSGNAWEWCSDWYDSYKSGPQINPEGPSTGGSRMLRGGYWFDSDTGCRLASRLGLIPGERSSIIGFRVARHSF